MYVKVHSSPLPSFLYITLPEYRFQILRRPRHRLPFVLSTSFWPFISRQFTLAARIIEDCEQVSVPAFIVLNDGAIQDDPGAALVPSSVLRNILDLFVCAAEHERKRGERSAGGAIVVYETYCFRAVTISTRAQPLRVHDDNSA